MKNVIPVAEPSLGEEELRNVIEAVKSGWISSKGHFIGKFEEEFARYIGVQHGIATSSGTTALHLALVALGIGPGDEVIIPDLTFASAANAIIYTGARPVLVDVHPDYWCLDPKKIEGNMTSKTKAIIVVHLYGHPCNMNLINKVAQKQGIYTVEDCAEAHGTEYKGRKVGIFGDVSCFSFYGNKIITTGEGGMCLTNDNELSEKMRILRDHGMVPEKRYWHELIGFNYRMTNMQAAVGIAQLKKLDKFIKRRREIAKVYNELLEDVKGLTLPPEMPWAKNVYWLYSMLVDKRTYGVNRDKLAEKLAKHGIETRHFFYPLHVMPPYRVYANSAYPVTEKLAEAGINLPSSTNLRDEEIYRIVKVIRDLQR